MMAAIFGVYMLIIWLVFAKLRLLRLSLPIAGRFGGCRPRIRVLYSAVHE